MISNSTYKVKSSKGAKEAPDYQDNPEDNYDNESVDGDATGDSNRRYNYYGRYKSRPRHDFKTRGSSDRRGGYRGRGGGILRRGDRDYPDSGYIINRKEAGRSYDTLQNNYYGKNYENDKKADIKLNLPEDVRISKLLRRLSLENNQDYSLDISRKLLEVLMLPDNALYVRKAFNILGESVLEILQVAPGPQAKCQVARCLGRMGYIMAQENDFERFQKWMFGKNQNCPDDISYLFMIALKETLALERKKSVLHKYSSGLVKELTLQLEAVENDKVFKATLDNVMSMAEKYPDEFYPHLRDIADLLIGWHVDTTQTLSTIQFISQNLQRISKHFQSNMEFSLTMVLHFLEDISTYSQHLHKKEQDSEEHTNNEDNSIEVTTYFISALNTILKCLGDEFKADQNKFVTEKIVNDCITQILETSLVAMEGFVADNLFIASNECIALLLNALGVKQQAVTSAVFTLIEQQLGLIHELGDQTIISMLLMISTAIRELAADIPTELVTILVGPESELLKFRFSPLVQVQDSVISVYQALLNVKNIPLLQEAYRNILGDFECIYRVLAPKTVLIMQYNPFQKVSCRKSEIELAVLFFIRCFSQLATTSGSLICMWAIQPSILELLVKALVPINESLYQKHPALQYSLLYLLYSHSKCYQHFHSISDLVTDGNNPKSHISVPENFSSNSGNFSIILDTLTKSLKAKSCPGVSLFLLQWFGEILAICEPFIERLYRQDVFVKLSCVVVETGYSKDRSVAIAVYRNLYELLTNKQLAWKNTFLSKVSDLCALHMKSNDPTLRKCYSDLHLTIPWDIAIVEFVKNQFRSDKHKNTTISRYSNPTIELAQNLHMNGNVVGEMQPLQFKILMKYLLGGEEQCLEDLFLSCWPTEVDTQSYTSDFRDLALNSRPVLDHWLTWEAAQFCVNTKLRTPLGKPNETFTSFETSLKTLARHIMKLKNVENPGIEEDEKIYKEGEEIQIRLLLQFMEHLEISIYNASEGCAVAIPQSLKPVRSFFSTNASTCKEWLSRMRIVLIQLSLHAGQSTLAYRHSEALLKDLVTNNKTNTSDFETAVVYAALSLLNLRESEALQGLYTWASKQSRNFDWLKPVIDHANKRFEAALIGYENTYLKLQQCESDSKNNTQLVRSFIGDQIMACNSELSQWKKILEWSEVSEKDNNLKVFRPISAENGQALYEFEVEQEMYAFNALSQWDNKTNWSVYESINSIETNLHKIATTLISEEKAFTADFLLVKAESTLCNIKKMIQNDLAATPTDFLQHTCLLNYVCNGLKNVLSKDYTSAFLVSEDFENEVAKVDSSVLSKVLWWSEYFASVQKNGFNLFCSNLRLNIVKKARKEKNINLACSQLYKFLQDKKLIDLGEKLPEHLLLKDVSSGLLQILPEISIWSTDTARGITELVKLLYDDPDSKNLTFNLCAIASTSISKFGNMNGRLELMEISAKILLKLAKWLQSNEQVSLTELGSPLGKFLMVLPEIGIMENSHSSIVPLNELAIGKLLQFSVQQCVGLAKAWNAFGTWCYRWGRKVVDSSCNLATTLTEEDKIAISNILPIDATEEDLLTVFKILQSRTAVEDEDIDSNEINTSEMIYNQLEKMSILRNCTEPQLQELVHIWIRTQKRIYSYYELSAEAYFKYLHLSSNSDSVAKNTEYNTVTVTLRLLRLIVRHALELQGVLENGLATTPTHPWKVIIPQLFSRLNHPEIYVRQRVSELLCRVAEDAPHLITFPAVVGALEGGVKFDFSDISLSKDCLSQANENNDENELNEMDDLYESDNEDSKSVLRGCFKSMVDTLSKQAPVTITQVQLLVKELRRIILLWDELWLGTLAQHHNEINKRQQQLELEIEKVNENSNLSKEEKISLITEKHRIIIKPIIYILEQLCDITTGVEPETPHEKKFQERYSDIIKEVLAKLKNPENPDKPQESWQLIKLLQTKFAQKNKRTSYSLKMQEISPVLFNLKDTPIAMPGVNSSTNRKLFVMQLANHVSILPTKTKPKKLVFYGSDGQTYTYLFKGLEDLHLDERIMQFLSIANTMMTQIETDRPERNLYRARHYSVIPLGPRSGLISWVDGTTPLFTLYKRWQQREATKSTGKTNANPVVLRPSDLFYNKLNPLLQEAGVKNTEVRKEWPLSVLKKVLIELMAETPSDLLAKELWCHAVNAGTWWQMVRKYTYSVAVMSIIGYIIGLGDRHLDNVLIDLTSGEVVHIDYNVCFEKGKTLRVPEKVPFRLTPNIKEALGVSGVEGIFRLSCENVLRTMKKGRETLLTLLEAFVYDPLVDWTVAGEGLVGTTFGGVSNTSNRQSRRHMEREVTISMFNVRCTELKVDWNTNRENILEEIPKVKEILNNWCEDNRQMREIEDCLQDLHQQMALIKEAEANGISKHSLYSLPSRYETFRKTQDILAIAKNELNKLVAESEMHLQKYTEALKTIESPKFTQWQLELNVNFDMESIRVFDLVKEFLQNAGQSNMISQCEQSENEVGQLEHQQTLGTAKCITLLQEYEAVLLQCPSSYLEKHRSFCCLRWCKTLLQNCSMNVCDNVFHEFVDLVETKNTPLSKIIAKFAYHIKVLHNEMYEQLTKLYKDYGKFCNDGAIVVLEKLYLDAKFGVSNFLKKEKGALKAFEFVLIGELLVLNKAFLQLETAVSRNGEWLIALKGRDGDWYLDEIAYNSSKALEFISYLSLQQNSKIEDPKFLQVVSGLHACDSIYKDLQELHVNFHTIILPESMRKIQSEEPNVLHMISELNKIIHSVGVPLPDLVIALEKHISCIVMEMDNNHSYDLTMEKINEIKLRYSELLQNFPDNHNPGKMLLVGFSGLFEKLNINMASLINALTLIDMPLCWRKIDQVNEAKSIAAPTYNKIRVILDDIFFIKRLQTMSEFFGLCTEMCKSSAGICPNVVVLTDEQLTKPVKKFISDFISRQFLGITTEMIAYVVCIMLQHLGLDVTNEIEQKDIGAENKVPLNDIYHKAWGAFIKNGLFTQNVVAQASSLVSNIKTAWEKLQEPKKLNHNINLLKSSVLRVQNQMTAHNWLYEEILRSTPYAQNTCTFVKSKFILDLRNEASKLSSTYLKLQESLEQQKILIGSVAQRLRWAAGANPDLNEVLSAFDSAVATRDTKLDREMTVTNFIINICNIILQHEVLRSPSPEATAYDEVFLSAFEKWKNACQYTNVKIDSVSPVEENIMLLYTPDMANNLKWVLLISEKISELIAKAQIDLHDQKLKTVTSYDKISSALGDLKVHYNQHVKIMADFKSLVKSMTKIEERAENAQKFISNYRNYIGNLSTIFHHFKNNASVEDAVEILEYLTYVEEHTPSIYDSLLDLEITEKKNDIGCATPVKTIVTKQEGGMKGQQRNMYAVNVWRRVRMKLEGRDPDPGRKYTIQEQVDYVIREATSLDNLALLYEGWTPWV